MPHTYLPTRRAASALLLAGLLPSAHAAAANTAAAHTARAAPPQGDARDADTNGALLSAVIAGPQRSAANKARDTARHPFETLRFFGLRPDQTVIEIAPGGGWYTEILAPYLREHGRFYAAHYPKVDGSKEQRAARERFEAKLAAEPRLYDHAVVGTLPTDGRGFTDIAPKGGADMVLTFRNVHNWIESGHLDETLRAFHAVLKPGGVLGVEEHRAPVGTPLARVIASGYVPEAFMVDRARAAGFELAGSSEVNANPRDSKDYPGGVWTLPPTLREGAVGRERFLAIGESDRMTLRFVRVG